MNLLKLTALVAALPLVAHDLYILPSNFFPAAGAPILIEAHNGDAFPQSEGAIEPERLLDAKFAGKALGPFRIDGKNTVADAKAQKAGSAYASFRTAPKFIQLDAAKFEAYLKEEGLNGVIQRRKFLKETAKPGREMYSKHAKSLITVGTGTSDYAKAVGHAIEFVPQADPAKLKPGMKLPVLLLLAGRAQPGIQVETSWSGGGVNGTRIEGRTDPDGRIDVAIDRAGAWRLHAVVMSRAKDAKQADWESLWASLTFGVR